MFLRRPLTTLGVCVAVGSLIVGCGSTETAAPSVAGTESSATASSATASSTSASPTTEPSAAVGVPDVLDFSAPLLRAAGAIDSIELDAGSFAGQPVAFWFWAPG